MVKKVIVISLGGSLIFKDNQINSSFLRSFKKTIVKNTKNYKFVIVCGGGSVARMYISGLKEINADEKLQSFAGISVTRTNARFMSYYFGDENEDGIAHTTNEVKKMISKKDIVFCGALEYHPKQTSDSTSAQIAEALNSEFINLTNVAGLHDKNPLEHKDARFIPEITWKDFEKMTDKISFKPGQHFVLDQKAAKLIKEKKIKTYILGPRTENLDNLLKGKNFKGTIISG
ncbi:MAG: UMP kinase [Candidatus Pacearchaeota archaeon]|jgi:uridylate kinase